MIRQRQRTDPRQQPTSTTFGPYHSSPFPGPKTLHPHHGGMSLTAPTTHNIQDFEQTGITNPGQTKQHNLQVAQQQLRQAHPSHQQNINEHEELYEDFRRFQHQQLDAQLNSMLRGRQAAQQYAAFDSVRMEKSKSNPEHLFAQHFPQSPMSDNSSGLLNPSLLQSNFNRPVSAHGVHEGGRGRSHEPRSLWHLQRPLTPTRPSNQDQFLLTPETSPHSDVRAREQTSQHHSPQFIDKHATASHSRGSSLAQSQNVPDADDYMDPDATIRANAQHNTTTQTSYLEMFSESPVEQESPFLPSPPTTAPTRTVRKFDATAMSYGMPLENMPKLAVASKCSKKEIITLQPGPHLPTANGCQDMDFEYAQSATSFHSARSSIDFGSCYGSPARGMDSPTNMSLANLDLDTTIEDTGISAQEVQSYMSEQDPNNGKWTCKFPGCGKEFGRRENIKSHVQTHLGDRQFKCLHCNKKFVRQHDLKRHSKIHSGVKPYPCTCGNSFARHDALTRHRQRGICSGGFEGVVKKAVKRGRPRKPRPDDDDRVNKASRTRKRVQAKSNSSSTSTASEYSYSESNSSPPAALLDFDNAEEQLGRLLQANSLDMSADFFSYTASDASSPASIEEIDSPDKTPAIDWATTPPQALEEERPTNSSSPQATVSLAEMSNQVLENSQPGSQPGSPPELSHYSPPLSAQLLDVDSRGAVGSLGLNGNGSPSHYETSPGFDMFDQDSSQGLFGSCWNGNLYLGDKSSANLRMDDYRSSNFCDEPLFPDHMHCDDSIM
ncbi:MAG: Metallothionein expression activator [Chrysothrix sp. TS-e1954]|nr:MAG: Metallothionein expression activator [Chrysothrix sp. TS-e1954]